MACGLATWTVIAAGGDLVPSPVAFLTNLPGALVVSAAKQNARMVRVFVSVRGFSLGVLFLQGKADDDKKKLSCVKSVCTSRTYVNGGGTGGRGSCLWIGVPA